MSASEYYAPSGAPGSHSSGASNTIRSEFTSIQNGFAKLPDLGGNGNLLVAVNPTGTGMQAKTAAQALAIIGAQASTPALNTLSTTTPTTIGTTLLQAADAKAARLALAGPVFSARSSSLFALSANVWTKIPLGTKDFDTDSLFDNITNYRFTPNIAGYYQFNAGGLLNTSTALLQLGIYKNGVQIAITQLANGSGAFVSSLTYLNGTADYVEVFINSSVGQTASGSLQGFLARQA